MDELKDESAEKTADELIFDSEHNVGYTISTQKSTNMFIRKVRESEANPL